MRTQIKRIKYHEFMQTSILYLFLRVFYLKKSSKTAKKDVNFNEFDFCCRNTSIFVSKETNYFLASKFRLSFPNSKLSRKFMVHLGVLPSDRAKRFVYREVDACQWTLCVTVSIIDSWLCRAGVSKFGGKRDESRAHYQCEFNAHGTLYWPVYREKHSVFLIYA